MNILSESAARRAPACVACGRLKDPGCAVCWDCFKYTDKFTPLKYYGGTFEHWLEREVTPYHQEVKERIAGRLGAVVPIRYIPELIEPEDLI